MRIRPTMIALLGVDGSGKSTAARQLARDLTARGIPARYFENAGGRPILDGLAHRLGRRDGRQLLGDRGYLGVEAAIRFLALTRAVVLSTTSRRVAVMDRYAYCQYALVRTRAGTTTEIGNDGESSPTAAPTAAERRIRRCYRGFPRPDAVFYLALPAELAAERVRSRGRDVEDPRYLAAFDAAYRTLPEFATFTVIDASAEPETVLAAVRGGAFPG
jgi:dTMP kinase